MKYFISDNDRQHTNYYEFQRGRFDGHTFWQPDSISLDDDVLWAHPDFEHALATALPGWNPYGETLVSPAQWQRLGHLLETAPPESLAIYHDANPWVEETFRTHGCFTIIGL